MAYTDFIAAIDLGSSHMVGMVGAKGPAGTLSIIAYEVENSDTCIRRGCVYNIKDAAGKIITDAAGNVLKETRALTAQERTEVGNAARDAQRLPGTSSKVSKLFTDQYARL